MKRLLLVVAALLLTAPAGHAAAATSPEQPLSKRAAKTLAVLNSLGVNDPQITQLVIEADRRHREDGYHLYEEKVPGGKVVLRYQGQSYFYQKNTLSNRIGLVYQFNDIPLECAGNTRSVMINYRLKF